MTVSGAHHPITYGTILVALHRYRTVLGTCHSNLGFILAIAGSHAPSKTSAFYPQRPPRSPCVHCRCDSAFHPNFVLRWTMSNGQAGAVNVCANRRAGAVDVRATSQPVASASPSRRAACPTALRSSSSPQKTAPPVVPPLKKPWNILLRVIFTVPAYITSPKHGERDAIMA